MKNTLLFIFLLLVGTIAHSQSNISAKLLGFTIHPGGDRTAELQPHKLDPNAVFVINYGFVVNYEKYIWEDMVSIKALQSFFLDCSAGKASATHIGIRGTFVNRNRHRLSIGLGPVFVVREDWNRLEGYESSGTMATHNSKLLGPVQYKFFPCGVEMEYDYQLTKKLDFSASMTPGIPAIISFGAGLRYWFNKDFTSKTYLPKMKSKKE